ncbi:MAG: DEAD/DEAH box helicase [Nitrospirae bacterium]|nr:DEAD/DEAH box helicase [Nitrospirota bacterium]MDE3042278.1 DEAD/DEAH box helicase [Nitrospirota bacterium]
MKHETTHPAVETPSKGFSPGFAALGLEAALLTTLDTLGYEEPTPIQREAIPPFLAGRDLLGQAATGTGKTAAFTLPMLQRIAHSARRCPSALILVPTRELAMQVGEAVTRYGKELKITVLPVYGGQAIGPQLHALKRGVDVIVATPGRALDHIRRKTLQLKTIQMVVLDEADEMLDMGFADDLDAILEQVPKERQTALFSATMPPRIASIAKRHLKEPVEIKIAKEPVKAGAAPRVHQTAYIVTRPHKVAALARILDIEAPKSALVFCRTRIEVDELTAMLTSRGHRAEAIHGGMNQPQRDRVMASFRAGQTELLVATDVAARGLDIPSVSHVVNYDLPTSPEVYVHRIGRTGRAGREGAAITVIDPREQRLLWNIEQLTKAKIVVTPVPTVADLRTKRLARTKAAIEEVLAAGDLGQFQTVVASLAEQGDPMEVAAAALKLVFRMQGGERKEYDIPAVSGRPQERPSMGRRPMGDPRERSGGMMSREGQGRTYSTPGRGGRTAGMAKVYIGAGREAGIRPGDLVGAIANEAGLNSNVIGAVEVMDRFSLVEVPEVLAREIIETLSRTRIKGQKVGVRLFLEQPRGGRA